MTAAWLVIGAAALLAAAFCLGRALRRFWRHTGQRVDRLAEPDDLGADPHRYLRPAPPGWPSRPTDQPPD